MITENSRFIVLKTAFAQLKISRYFRLLFIISILFSAMLLIPIIDVGMHEIIRNIVLIASSICLFFIFIAIMVGVHEEGHLSVCKKLGVKAFLSVQRLGDVWLNHPKEETIDKDESYQFIIAPYTRVIDYFLTPFFFLIWILITINLPIIPAIGMWIISLPFAIIILANYCAYATVKFKLKRGFIPKIAWLLTSRADLEEILEYHNVN